MNVDTTPESLLAEAGHAHRLARALLRDADLAHDVAQDALVAVLQRRDAAGGGALAASPRGWLAAVVGHLAARTRRRRQERAARELRAARPEGDDAEARTAERLRLHRDLTEAVGSLPEPYRTAITLRYFDGLPPRAIARRRGQTPAAVRQHVHRGLALLRQRLDRSFGSRHAWTFAFGIAGLGEAAAIPLALLAPIAMKKLAVAAVAVLAAGSIYVWQRDPAPVSDAPAATDAVAGADAAAATGVAKQPAAETAPARITATVPAEGVLPFTVTVAAADGTPLADATVHAWRAGAEPTERRADARGRAEFAPEPGPGGVLVRAPGCVAVLREVERLTGEFRVEVGGGSGVRGTVLADGEPAPGLKLSLSGRQPQPPADVPPAVRDLLGDWLPLAETVTDAHGAFAFAGLPSDWSGSLATPRTHWLLAQPGQTVDEGLRYLQLPSPQGGLVVMTTKLPGVAGRVVWADTGEPVRRPRLMVHGRFADGEDSSAIGSTGDEDGRFACGLWPGSHDLRARWLEPARRSPLVEVGLSATAEGCDGATKLRIGRELLQAGGEVVVRLRRAAVTHFLVLAQDGRPIAGARVQVRDVGPPTGADGRGTFAGPRDDLIIGAPGCQVVPAVPRAPAAGTLEDPWVFVLAPANALVLHLRTPAGLVPRVQVVLRSDENLFAGRTHQCALDNAAGDTEASAHWRLRPRADGTSEAYDFHFPLTADEQGRIVLHSLEPGRRCTAFAFDKLGTELAREAITIPPPGGQREVTLVVAGTPRRVRGRVVDENGTALAGVGVVLVREAKDEDADGRWGLPSEDGATSAADGGFAFEDVHAEGPLVVTVRHKGWVPVRQAVAPGRHDEPILLQLFAARTVTVQVRDERDQVVPLPIDVVDEADLHAAPQSLAPGKARFEDLPPGAVTFWCELGGKRFELRHDTSAAAAVLRVPGAARVRFVLPGDWVPPGEGRCQVVATPLDAPERRALRFDVPQKTGDETLLLGGRYRFTLEHEARDLRTKEVVVTPLGPAATLELRAGEAKSVELRR